MLNPHEARRDGIRAPQHLIRWLGGSLVALGLMAHAPQAQTLYTYDGANALVHELSQGNTTATFPAGGAPCALPGPTLNPLLGGLCTDTVNDTVFSTDGLVVTETTATGTVLRSWTFASLTGLTGLCMDSAAGILYATDGARIVGVLPPAASCSAETVVVPAWNASVGALITGLTYHFPLGSVMAIDGSGFVLQTMPGAPSQVFFNVFPDMACGGLLGATGTIPTGIAFDRATPGAYSPDSFFITDGVHIVHMLLGNGPVPPNPYSPPCMPAGAAPIHGLAYASHTLIRGAGSDVGGLTPPSISTSGQFTTPSGNVAMHLTGADPTPGTVAFAFGQVGFPFGPGLANPPLVGLGGVLFHLTPPWLLVVGPIPVVNGSATLATTLGPNSPIGVELELQWIVIKANGNAQGTPAATVSLGWQ
jgi:hypothetical protein